MKFLTVTQPDITLKPNSNKPLKATASALLGFKSTMKGMIGLLLV
jgi:hypothetical protein